MDKNTIKQKQLMLEATVVFWASGFHACYKRLPRRHDPGVSQFAKTVLTVYPNMSATELCILVFDKLKLSFLKTAAPQRDNFIASLVCGADFEELRKWTTILKTEEEKS
jgi:hypothetical protein